ncbi:hypothetical protein EfmJHP35_16520 [Enterococcus faecium]|nr:hypothetical protein EfmJHP35_16520 [Enterococcus faecium]
MTENEVDTKNLSREQHLEGDTTVGIHHKSAVITLQMLIYTPYNFLRKNDTNNVDIENSINELS